MSDFPVSQSLALFECGEPKENLTFSLSGDENDSIVGTSKDKLYHYILSPSDVNCAGTLIIRDKTTGEMKAVPVEKFMMVSRQSKFTDFTKMEATDTATLVNQFGTRQAKRIYNLRQGSAK